MQCLKVDTIIVAFEHINLLQKQWLRWAAFLEWNIQQDHPVCLKQVTALVEELRLEMNDTSLQTLIHSPGFEKVDKHYKLYCESLGPKGQF